MKKITFYGSLMKKSWKSSGIYTLFLGTASLRSLLIVFHFTGVCDNDTFKLKLSFWEMMSWSSQISVFICVHYFNLQYLFVLYLHRYTNGHVKNLRIKSVVFSFYSYKSTTCRLLNLFSVFLFSAETMLQLRPPCSSTCWRTGPSPLRPTTSSCSTFISKCPSRLPSCRAKVWPPHSWNQSKINLSLMKGKQGNDGERPSPHGFFCFLQTVSYWKSTM